MEDITQYPVVFYNVEILFDTFDDPKNEGDDDFTPNGVKEWDSKRYQKKLTDLSKAISLINGNRPLFLGLAEVENRQVVEDLITQSVFKGGNYEVIHFESPDRRGIDCAFSYDASLFTVTEFNKLTVKLPEDSNFVTRDILEIQGFFEEKQELYIFVNHWPSRREGEEETRHKRVAAAQVLKQRLNEILTQNEDANILVMGDFNDLPSSTSIRDTLQALGQHEQKQGTLVSLMSSYEKKEDGSIVHDDEWETVDQFIVSQELMKERNLHVEDNKAYILKHKELLYTNKNGEVEPQATYGGLKYYGGFSDHLPIYLFLSIKK